MKNIIFYFIIAILASSCEKNTSSNGMITLEGTLMASCNTPAANKSGYFHYTGGMTRYTWGEFTTDDKGYFKITEKIGGSPLTLWVSGDVLRNINPFGKDLDLGKVYIAPFPTNFIIKLDVKNHYTENDTLFIKDFWDIQIPPRWKAISGPFISATLDTVYNDTWRMFPINWWDLVNHGGAFNRVMADLKNSETNQRESKSVNFYTTPICSGEFAEVTLVID